VTIFSFRKTAHRCNCVCVTQSNWVKNVISCFSALTGSAEAQVIWGGTVKRLLIAYFIGNISAKNIKIHYVRQSYSKTKVGRFLRHGVYCSLWRYAPVRRTSTLQRTGTFLFQKSTGKIWQASLISTPIDPTIKTRTQQLLRWSTVWPQEIRAEKWGLLCPFPWVGGAGSPSNTMWSGLRSTSITSSILIHPTVWP